MVTTMKPTTTRDVARVDRPVVRRGMNDSHPFDHWSSPENGSGPIRFFC